MSGLRMLKPKQKKVLIPHWRDDSAILKRIDSIKKKTKASYSDIMRKIVRDGLEANE